MSKKIKFLKYRPYNCNSCTESVESFVKIFPDMVQDGEVGEKFIVEIVEMTQEEYDNLPEFEGF